MDGRELSQADKLVSWAGQAWSAERPGRVRESLLRARGEYQRLHRPADVSMVDVLLAEQLTRVQDRELAWDRLLHDVGWSPPQPGARPDELTVACSGGQHSITISADWTVMQDLSESQHSEHVARALLGSEPECVKVSRDVRALRRWATCRQRLAPTPGAWVEPNPLVWEAPHRVERGWGWEAVTAYNSYLLVDDPSLWGIEDPMLCAVFERAMEDDRSPRPPENEALQAAVLLDSLEAIDELWQVGVHPALVLALDEALSLDRPISPQTVAQLVLRRAMGFPTPGFFEELWMDDPLPVSLLLELLGATRGILRQRMCDFLAAAGGSRDIDDPSRLMRWWAEHDLPVETRVRLHRLGFEPLDLSRWAQTWEGMSVAKLAVAMRRSFPVRSKMPSAVDQTSELIEDHFRTWLSWASDYTEWGELPWHSCHAHIAELSDAVEQRESRDIMRIAEMIDREHPSIEPTKGGCPIWVASCVQALAALHDTHPETAKVPMEVIRSAEATEAPDQGAARHMAERIWVALERADGRPVTSLPVVESVYEAALLYSLLEWPATQRAQVETWAARYGRAVHQVWHKIRRSGVTLEQAARWQPDGSSDADYVLWLSDYIPYPGPVEDPFADPWEWLITEGRRRARIWAGGDHRRLYGPDPYNEEWETRSCLEDAYPALEQALDQGTESQVAAAARRAVDSHTYYGDAKSYRYHLDDCPVCDLGRLVLGLAAFRDGSSEVWDLLIGDGPEIPQPALNQDEYRYPSPVCLAAFLGLTHSVGRLVDSEVVRSKWRRALSRTGVDGPWMLRMILEAG